MRFALFCVLLAGCSSTAEDPPVRDATPEVATDAAEVDATPDVGCAPDSGPICCEPGAPPAEPVCTGHNAWQCPLGTIATNRTTGCSG